MAKKIVKNEVENTFSKAPAWLNPVFNLPLKTGSVEVQLFSSPVDSKDGMSRKQIAATQAVLKQIMEDPENAGEFVTNLFKNHLVRVDVRVVDENNGELTADDFSF